MTLAELYANALRRDRQLRSSKRFSRRSFKAWLDKQVAAGLLERRDGRYYLTAEGYDVATQLQVVQT